ncbi:unnamed protein product [Oncorhynchus mykiss]|uniref:Transposase Tc1-like domain-containing protein n=1 Tax=Oncorhynchus mykiss TaxID=8022 RepID=A0A060VSM4_ONCMY|nr:unnamed protein product [Oncorhynchus mykiss]
MAAQQGRSHCSKTAIKKPRFAIAHGDKDHTFWRNVLWSDETRIELFGHNHHRGSLQAEEHHPNPEARGWQHHVVGVFCCRRDWCTSQNRWHHEAGKLCGYIEATSQDINQEVKACVCVCVCFETTVQMGTSQCSHVFLLTSVYVCVCVCV